MIGILIVLSAWVQRLPAMRTTFYQTLIIVISQKAYTILCVIIGMGLLTTIIQNGLMTEKIAKFSL